MCRELGWRIDESIQEAPHWKGVYLKAKLRMVQLQDQEAFETSSLIGHSARVYALYYKDGLLCTGTLGLAFTFYVAKADHTMTIALNQHLNMQRAVLLHYTEPMLLLWHPIAAFIDSPCVTFCVFAISCLFTHPADTRPAGPLCVSFEA